MSLDMVKILEKAVIPHPHRLQKRGRQTFINFSIAYFSNISDISSYHISYIMYVGTMKWRALDSSPAYGLCTATRAKMRKNESEQRIWKSVAQKINKFDSLITLILVNAVNASDDGDSKIKYKGIQVKRQRTR